MNNQSKSMVVNALIKVVNSAPTIYSQPNSYYPSTYQRTDISMPEFDSWVNYVNQTLDISYNHIGLDIIFSAKIVIAQISSQQATTFIQRIEQIKQTLLNLAQSINQY